MHIIGFNTHIAGSNYKFGYVVKHILTTLEGEKETLMEEVKYGDLNSEVTAQFYNDNALYSTYYFADEEMPTSKLYANGKTVLEVNYQEVAVDFDNLTWNAELVISTMQAQRIKNAQIFKFNYPPLIPRAITSPC